MCDFESFKIDLKGLKEDQTVLEYQLDEEYFKAIEAPEIQRGQLLCKLEIKRVAGSFELNFHINGFVHIPCDLCLDDMEQTIATDNRLVVKFGDDYSEDDDLVTVPENEGMLDVAWFIYEFIVLNIPIKHVHAPGKCNAQMMKVLEEHSAARSSEEDDEKPVDPRWAALQQLKD